MRLYLMRNLAIGLPLALFPASAFATVFDGYVNWAAPELGTGNESEHLLADPLNGTKEAFILNPTIQSTAPCCVNGKAITEVAEGNTDPARPTFGSLARINMTDWDDKARTVRAGGAVSGFYKSKSGASEVADIPFRISHTTMTLANGAAVDTSGFPSDASVAFDIEIYKYDFGTGAIDQVFAAEYSAFLDSGGLDVSQSGFDDPIADGVFDDQPFVKHWDLGVFEGSIDLSDAGIGIDDTYFMVYTWDTMVRGGFAQGYTQATFYDPIGEEGGLSVDVSAFDDLLLDFNPLIQPPPPSAVPLPPAAGLLVAGFLGLVGIARTRKTPSR